MYCGLVSPLLSFYSFPSSLTYLYLGNGKENGILSAIMSNFTAPGILFNKTVTDCSPAEIQAEVWAQMKAHLNVHSGMARKIRYAICTLTDVIPL